MVVRSYDDLHYRGFKNDIRTITCDSFHSFPFGGIFHILGVFYFPLGTAKEPCCLLGCAWWTSE